MAEVSFGEWLRRQRKAAGLTQDQLALQISCSTSALKKIEAEERRPSAQIVERLAEIFNIPQNERTAFLRFARGDWRAVPAGVESTPWLFPHIQEREDRSKLTIRLVTFLFTDIEDSAKLWESAPKQMKVALGRHHAILQEAIESNRGTVFQIVGDAFCAAFPTAASAVFAAVTAQHGLYREYWNLPFPIRVRMGIHTGEAEPTINGSLKGGYESNQTLNRVARILAAGHGGQILLSFATKELAKDSLPENTELRDMGEHYLKNLIHPEHLFQLTIAGLPSEFSSLNTLAVRRHNLPLQLTSFIGREKEMEEIKQSILIHKLVTLTGAGGTGKSRLSLQVAADLLDEFSHGVWLVELAPITDPPLVIQAVCAALDVTPQGHTSALKTLTDYLRPKKILLVIDNCEHLIDACAQLAEALLHACPDLRIIASSREALGIEGESAYHVPSLSLADSKSGLHVIKQSEAVQLFVARASAILPGYALTEVNASTIAKICRRLDGIALAIELAASRVKLLKVEQIAARLEDAFRLLTGGSRTALPRQQTLRGTIDWSYNLLTDEERIVLRRLSVFVGGWTLDAAEAVCDNPDILDLLTHLVDKSLVAVDREHSKEARYYLLETIRQYAREKLAESGEGEQTRARHLDYLLKLAQRAEPELHGAGQIEWSQKLENEYENMRAALEWSLQGNVSVGQQLASALWWAWDYSGHLSEGYEWLEKMLAATPGDETLIRAKLLSGAGWLAAMLGYSEQIAVKFSEESIALFRQLGNQESAAFSLATLATRAYYRSDYGQAIALAEESRELFRKGGNKWGIRHALGILGYTAEAQGNFQQAQKFYEESLSICKEIGDKEGRGWTLYIMGWLAESQGDDARAMELYEEALEIEKTVKQKPVSAWILRNIAIMSLRRGDHKSGKLSFEEAIEIYRKMGDQNNLAYSLQRLGLCERLQGDYPKARSLYSESLELSQRMQDNRSAAECLIYVGQLIGVQGSPEKFVRLLGMAEGIVPDIQKVLYPFVRAETEKFIEAARSALGDEAYTAAWESGKQTSLEEAIAFALKELRQ